MTKLLMLITSLVGGGAERVPSELSLNLTPNIKRRIVTLTNKIEYPSDEKPISMNFSFFKPEFFSFIYVLIFGTFKYRRIVKSHRADVSLSFLVLDNFINILSNIGNKKTKVIVSVHAAMSRKFGRSLMDRLIKILMKLLYKNADLIIAVSDGVKQELIRDFNLNHRNIKVVYNPLDIEKIECMAKEDVVDEKWFIEDIPIIINVGRLTEAKGQWHLIRAFSEVVRLEKCRLCIIGEGPLELYLISLINGLNLGLNVKLLGWKSNPFKYVKKSSLFVLTSVSEALPYVLIEAMACGCPVISTDCKYGPREILNKGEYGILVPPMDGKFYNASAKLTHEEKYLAKEIVNLLKKNEIREFYSTKSNIRKLVFNQKEIITKYEKLFYNCINNS